MDCSYDFLMTCLPSCQSEDNPPRYKPITFAEYQTFYRKANYDALPAAQGGAAAS